MFAIAIFVLTTLFWAFSLAKNVNLDWNVGWIENVNLDGKFNRRVIGINGIFPPPIIMINQTDSLTINFKNAFGDGRSTALHSHGMFFNNTGYFDGASFITQCPIPDGESISYQPYNSPFSPISSQQQWGTYWTHGHYDGQYVDGLRTPAIIHATDEPYRYDDDFTIILADWYHEEHYQLMNEILNVNNPQGIEPVPQSGLVYFAHTAKGKKAEYLSGYNENATLSFEPGKVYRLRLINMAAFSRFQFWIEGHEMSIIEVDGVDTKQLPVEKVSLAVAQRYSVLVRARNNSFENWPIHFNLDPIMYTNTIPKSLQLNITSTIVYKTGNPMGSDRPTIEYEYFDDTILEPIVAQPQINAEESFVKLFDWKIYGDGKSYAYFNDTTFINPLTPSLFTASSMPTNESKLPIVYGPNGNAIVVDHMKAFEIVILNPGPTSHPFHLHGHQFQVVHKSQDINSNDPKINPPKKEGQLNPLRRDTVIVPATGSVSLRLIADNPGAWILHCHIDFHLSVGLAMVLIEAPEKIQENIKIPRYMFEQCKQQGLPFTGNAGGIESMTNFGALPVGPKPLISGWTVLAIITMLICAIMAVLGIGTILWFNSSKSPKEEEEEEGEEDNT